MDPQKRGRRDPSFSRPAETKVGDGRRQVAEQSKGRMLFAKSLAQELLSRTCVRSERFEHGTASDA